MADSNPARQRARPTAFCLALLLASAACSLCAADVSSRIFVAPGEPEPEWPDTKVKVNGNVLSVEDAVLQLGWAPLQRGPVVVLDYRLKEVQLPKITLQGASVAWKDFLCAILDQAKLIARVESGLCCVTRADLPPFPPDSLKPLPPLTPAEHRTVSDALSVVLGGNAAQRTAAAERIRAVGPAALPVVNAAWDKRKPNAEVTALIFELTRQAAALPGDAAFDAGLACPIATQEFG